MLSSRRLALNTVKGDAMNWVDEVLDGKSKEDDARQSLDNLKANVKKVFDAYLSENMDADEARLFTQHTFNKRFDEERYALSINQSLTDNYIMDCYIDLVGEEDE